MNIFLIHPMKFALVVAADKNNGIGKNNTLAWRLPSDLKFFSDITTKVDDSTKQNAVIMGRKTWESLPEKHRPLKNRLNVVISRNADFPVPSNVMLVTSLNDALQKISQLPNIENIHVIGGAMLFAEAINHPDCQTIYLTRLDGDYKCDAFFPQIDEKVFELKKSSGPQHENNIDFEFLTLERKA